MFCWADGELEFKSGGEVLSVVDVCDVCVVRLGSEVDDAVR